MSSNKNYCYINLLKSIIFRNNLITDKGFKYLGDSISQIKNL